jgi:hypothetical protein
LKEEEEMWWWWLVVVIGWRWFDGKEHDKKEERQREKMG